MIINFQLASELDSVGLKPENRENPYLYTPETYLKVNRRILHVSSIYFQVRSLIDKTKYKFPEDCYGYFCPEFPEESGLKPRINFAPDWAGLTLLSNILVMTAVMTMSSETRGDITASPDIAL